MSLLTKEDVEKLVTDASPHDGFGIKDVITGDDHAMFIVFRRNGVPVNPPWRIGQDPGVGKMVWQRKAPTDKDFGDKARARLLLQAMCRYLNTCGTWEQFDQFVKDLWSMSQGSFTMELCNFHLIDSCCNTEGVYEHVFASDVSPFAIRWVEGSFFDVMSLVDLQQELREMADEEAAAHGRAAGPGVYGGPPLTGSGEGARKALDVQREEDPRDPGRDEA